MMQRCTGCGRATDPVRIFCMYCGRRIEPLPQRRRGSRQSLMAIFAITGLMLGGIAGYVIRPPGGGMLLSRTAHAGVLRGLILAMVGLLAGAAVGRVMDRRDG